MTEYSLIYESGRLPAIVELYGDMDGREKHLSELRKSEQAYTVEIPKALKIEGETIQRLRREPAHQADCIKKKMDEHISTYLEARETAARLSRTLSARRLWMNLPCAGNCLPSTGLNVWWKMRQGRPRSRRNTERSARRPTEKRMSRSRRRSMC